MDITEQNKHLNEFVEFVNTNITLHKNEYGHFLNMAANMVSEQIKEFHNLIGDVDYIVYIIDNLKDHDQLSMLAKGSPLLDKDRGGSLYTILKQLKQEYTPQTFTDVYDAAAMLIDIISNLTSILTFVKRDDATEQNNMMRIMWQNGYRSIEIDSQVKQITNYLLAFDDIPRYAEINDAITQFNALCGAIGLRVSINQPEHEQRFVGEITKVCITLNKFVNSCVKYHANAQPPQPVVDDHQDVEFSKMRSYTPVKECNLNALYEFLIRQGVIKNADEELFANCISHANISAIFPTSLKAKFKCVIDRRLKTYYTPDWYDEVCNSVGLTKDQMKKYNLGGTQQLKEFTNLIPI